MFDTSKTRWHPIAGSDDLPERHVYQAQLLGREFAVWRADDGYVNVWENRCLHRGVRLSIGINDGHELTCQYHGWRYSNRTSGCTYIPAHPADAPARTICNRTFRGVERFGLVWSAEEPIGEPPAVDALTGRDPLPLRPIPVNAAADRLVEALNDYHFQPTGGLAGDGARVAVEASEAFSVVLRARDGDAETLCVFFVQPVDAGRAVIRGVLDSRPGEENLIEVLRHHDARLEQLRTRIERLTATEPTPPQLTTEIKRLAPDLAELPELPKHGRKATITVTVARKWQAGEGIAGFELRPVEGLLPTFKPGAHIDVHLPNGLIRQYSIINGPGESDRYAIGVKLETESGGGSRCLHETVRQGDNLAISEPRDNFVLRRDATETIFVAGGIGVTPLLAMAQALANQRRTFRFHYFAASEPHMAFPDRLAVLGDAVEAHLGLGPDETSLALSAILSNWRAGRHLYVCGPGPMLEAARRIAAACGWPEDAVHFEYFKNTNKIDDSSGFEVALARSCMTLQVPAGRTILEVMREAGIDMPSSCEQGACGTCLATVIEGEPHHQDVYLSEAERRSGTCIMTCVSRAKTPRLVLDL